MEPRWRLRAGVAWGVAALVRPNALIFVPLLAVWLAWMERSRGARAIVPAAVLVLGIAAPILPVTVYNWTVGGDRVLISSGANAESFSTPCRQARWATVAFESKR